MRPRPITSLAWVAAAALLSLSVGCADDAAEARVVERALLRVPGAQPSGSPDEYNSSVVLRFHEPGGGPVDAVVVCMPGFLGGGNAFRPLAEHLVRRGGVEVWAVDRRANGLEDLRGARAEDPEAAAAYYRDGGAIEGKTFEGYHAQADVAFMKEWGLAVHAQDLRAVVDEAGALHPEAAIYLAGHSLGASFAEAYAAHFFQDGTSGADDLSGLILIDGVLGAVPMSQDDHAAQLPGLAPYTALPFLGVQIYSTLLIAARRAQVDPDGVVVDPERDAALSLMLSVVDMPKMTHRAVVGFALDGEFNPLAMLHTSLGDPTGGAIGEYDNPLTGEVALHPTDKDATYGWVDALDADPPELTPIDNVLRSTVDPHSDFAEWYFPTRLSHDLGATIPTEVALPVLSIPAGLFPDSMAAVADRMAPGASFVEVDARHMAHVDVIVAADIAANPVPDAIAAFVR